MIKRSSTQGQIEGGQQGEYLSYLFSKFLKESDESERIAMVAVLREFVMTTAALHPTDRQASDLLGEALLAGLDALKQQYALDAA